MSAAEESRKKAAAAKAKLVRAEEKKRTARERKEKAIEREVRRGFAQRFAKEFKPNIDAAEERGENTVVLYLGSSEGSSPEYKIRQEVMVRCLREHLEADEYKVNVSYPFRRYSDDDPGQEEIDVGVGW